MKSVQLEEITTKILNLRAIERLIRTDEFQAFSLSDQEKEYIQSLIEKADKETFKRWIKHKRKTNNLTIRTLRAKARSLGIQNWYNLDQQSLIHLVHHDLQNTIEQNTC